MRYFLFITSIIFLTSCSSKKPNEENYTGFLQDYNQLIVTDSADDEVQIMAYTSAHLQKGLFNSIIIDPVVLYPKISELDDFTKKEIQVSLDYLHKELAKELGLFMKIVHTPGPHTLRLRVALTSVGKQINDLSWYQYLPMSLAITAASEVTGFRDQAVYLFIESELSNSYTQEILAAGVRKDFAKPIDNEADISFKHIQPILDHWAKTAAKYTQENIY